MAAYRIISADSHLNEPIELYQRLPAAFRDRAPRLEERDGRRFFIVEGQPPRPIEAVTALNEDDKRRYWREAGDDDVGQVFHRAGGTDIALRLRDQEEDGISAEVIYPHGTFNTFSSRDPAQAAVVETLRALRLVAIAPAPEGPFRHAQHLRRLGLAQQP